jgi:hypothetical protein
VDTPADTVYETVKGNITTFSRNGGYIFAGVHNLPGDMPEAHLNAMLQAYRDSREGMRHEQQAEITDHDCTRRTRPGVR